MNRFSHTRLLAPAMFFAMIAWGSTWVSAKILGEYLGSFELIFWRFSLAAVGLVPIIVLLKHSWKIGWKNALLALLSGWLLVLYNYLFFRGCHLGAAGFGGVLVTTLIPVVTFVLIALLGRKRLARVEILALGIGALGTMTILRIWEYGPEIWSRPGVKYFILAALTWPFITILSARLHQASAIVFSFYMFVVAAIVIYFFILKGVTSPIIRLPARFWINLGLLSLFGTSFGTGIYFIASAKRGSKWASSYFFLVPFSAALFAAIFLHEPLGFATIAGGALTLLAIYRLNGYRIRIKGAHGRTVDHHR